MLKCQKKSLSLGNISQFQRIFINFFIHINILTFFLFLCSIEAFIKNLFNLQIILWPRFLLFSFNHIFLLHQIAEQQTIDCCSEDIRIERSNNKSQKENTEDREDHGRNRGWESLVIDLIVDDKVGDHHPKNAHKESEEDSDGASNIKEPIIIVGEHRCRDLTTVEVWEISQTCRTWTTTIYLPVSLIYAFSQSKQTIRAPTSILLLLPQLFLTHFADGVAHKQHPLDGHQESINCSTSYVIQRSLEASLDRMQPFTLLEVPQTNCRTSESTKQPINANEVEDEGSRVVEVHAFVRVEHGGCGSEQKEGVLCGDSAGRVEVHEEEDFNEQASPPNHHHQESEQVHGNHGVEVVFQAPDDQCCHLDLFRTEQDEGEDQQVDGQQQERQNIDEVSVIFVAIRVSTVFSRQNAKLSSIRNSNVMYKYIIFGTYIIITNSIPVTTNKQTVMYVIIGNVYQISYMEISPLTSSENSGLQEVSAHTLWRYTNQVLHSLRQAEKVLSTTRVSWMVTCGGIGALLGAFIDDYILAGDKGAHGIVVAIEEADAHHDGHGEGVEEEDDQACFVFGCAFHVQVLSDGGIRVHDTSSPFSCFSHVILLGAIIHSLLLYPLSHHLYLIFITIHYYQGKNTIYQLQVEKVRMPSMQIKINHLCRNINLEIQNMFAYILVFFILCFIWERIQQPTCLEALTA